MRCDMLYCPKCKKLSESSRCEHCGNKKLTEPTADTPVFLISKNPLWSGMIEDVLEDNSVPFLKKIAHGDGITEAILGYGMEVYSFYVPYERLNEAHELVFPLFTPIDSEEET